MPGEHGAHRPSPWARPKKRSVGTSFAAEDEFHVVVVRDVVVVSVVVVVVVVVDDDDGAQEKTYKICKYRASEYLLWTFRCTYRLKGKSCQVQC